MLLLDLLFRLKEADDYTFDINRVMYSGISKIPDELLHTEVHNWSVPGDYWIVVELCDTALTEYLGEMINGGFTNEQMIQLLHNGVTLIDVLKHIEHDVVNTDGSININYF